MPAFSIFLHSYNPNETLYVNKDLRIGKLFSRNHKNKQFTKEDCRNACIAIKDMMKEYNKGLRGDSFSYKYIGNNNENKNNQKE